MLGGVAMGMWMVLWSGQDPLPSSPRLITVLHVPAYQGQAMSTTRHHEVARGAGMSSLGVWVPEGSCAYSRPESSRW